MTTSSVGGQAPDSGTGLTVTPAAGPGATAVAVTGGGCKPGTVVAISFRGGQLARARVGLQGEFSVTVVIPAHASTGTGSVSTAGPGCRLSAPFTVQAGTVASPGSPSTHGAVGFFEVLAGLAVFGAVLVFAVRRRRQTPPRESELRPADDRPADDHAAGDRPAEVTDGPEVPAAVRAERPAGGTRVTKRPQYRPQHRRR